VEPIDNGVRQTGQNGRAIWMIVCVAAQAATLAITWPLWETRQSPPHLPWVHLPQIPFGGILMCSLILILFRPQLGVRFHIGVLAASWLFDQWRIQPQVIGIAVLLLATTETWGPAIAKSYLIAMWFWSGLDPATWHAPFAYSIAIGEIILGVLAVARPRWAAIGCAALHLSIALFLSPLVHNWNVSVIGYSTRRHRLALNCGRYAPLRRCSSSFRPDSTRAGSITRSPTCSIPTTFRTV
jgi:hypothetical protein